MEERNRLALGALLHDIGKVLQRADVPLSGASLRMESVLCPTAVGGRYSHRHVLWTHEFFQSCFRDMPDFTLGEDSVANIASFHHRPCTPLQTIVQTADCLSSGLDRLPDDAEARDPLSYKKERLVSVFSFVDLARDPSWRPLRYRYDIGPLRLRRDALFPKLPPELNPPHGELLVEEYRRLWEGTGGSGGLASELGRCPAEPEGFLFDAVSAVLERYLWCVPSSTVDLPDVSLFDHLKSTAAISLCLYDAGNEPEPFLLAAGDISGIQRFIYQVAQAQGIGGVARRLRGRSLFLTFLPEVFSRSVLSKARLTSANLVFCGGGRFEMLLPNTETVREVLDAELAAMNSWLLSEFGGDLCLVLTYVTFSRQGILDYSAQLTRLESELESAKRRKFLQFISGGACLPGNEVSGPLEVCRSCQVAAVPKGSLLCRHCASQQRAGQVLPRSKLVVVTGADTVIDAPYLDYGPCGRAYLLGDGEDPVRLAKVYGVRAVLGLNDMTASPFGHRFLGASVPIARSAFWEAENEAAYEAGDVLGFETIAGLSCGDRKLGILAMDVDYLGLVFRFGLEGEGAVNRSMARLSTLSRMLDLFFSGYLNVLCRDLSREKDTHLTEGAYYVLYSGGDDLVCIGPWDAVTNLALRIQQEFSAFTCRNPNISVSAGISVVKPKFPIARAISLAKEALDGRSKRVGRGRITFFGETVPWERSDGEPGADELIELGELLAENVEGALPRGFLHLLLRVHRQYAGDGVVDPLYVVRLVYQISRNIARTAVMKDGRSIKEFLLEKFVSGIHSAGYFRRVRVPATYALMKTRDGGTSGWQNVRLL